MSLSEDLLGYRNDIIHTQTTAKIEIVVRIPVQATLAISQQGKIQSQSNEQDSVIITHSVKPELSEKASTQASEWVTLTTL